MTTARYYDAGKNPDGAFLPGVPLRDLTDDELAALPPHLQAGVAAAPFYRTTKPKAAPAAEEDTSHG